MRQEGDKRSEGLRIFALGKLIEPRRTRRLFVIYCREVSRFSARFEVDVGPFDVTLREPDSGFSVVVTPLRDLFLVSLGESRSVDMRVSSADGFFSALDFTLERYLAASSMAASAV